MRNQCAPASPYFHKQIVSQHQNEVIQLKMHRILILPDSRPVVNPDNLKVYPAIVFSDSKVFLAKKYIRMLVTNSLFVLPNKQQWTTAHLRYPVQKIFWGLFLNTYITATFTEYLDLSITGYPAWHIRYPTGYKKNQIIWLDNPRNNNNKIFASQDLCIKLLGNKYYQSVKIKETR